VVPREYLDGATEITFIDVSNPLPFDGVLDAWRVWSDHSVLGRMQVFRAGATGYTLVGENTIPLVTGFNEVAIGGPSRVSVEAGDFIGFRYDEDQFIPIDSNTSFSTIWTQWPNPSVDVAVGDTIDFASFYCCSTVERRAYSFAANVTAVPLPSTFSMSLLGFALVAAVGSRRRRVEDLYR
jgi:hypothetical protein